MTEFFKSVLVVLLAAAAGVLMVVFLRATSVPRLTEGVVVDKTFQPAYDSIDTTGSSKNRSVKIHHHSARWEIKVSGMNEEGAAVAEWWKVGKGMYDMIEIGDRVRREPRTGVISISGEMGDE